MENKDWFETWFDSPYYHILYQHRNNAEAELFINNLFQYLKIEDTDSILDLACGAGRHSISMAKKGNKVLGIDLAKNSITEAKKSARSQNISHIEFQVEDMRDFKLDRKFNFIFNLFTSFGYFDDKVDNLRVINCIAKHLESNGVVVIDYLNSTLVRANGEESYTKELDGIQFNINKYFEKDFVIKQIEVNDKGTISKFREQVQLFEHNEIESMLNLNGFESSKRFGDYSLNIYREDSARSIFIAQQKL